METWTIIPPPPGTMEMPMVDVGRITRKFLDIPYASQSPSQKLDIYLPPEGDGPFPTVIFIHGGAFLFGDKRDVQLMQALCGINRGYAVVSVGYRLALEAKYPLPLFDVKAAIRFLRANAVRYMLDADRFGLCGDSAGGYYAVMAAATQGNAAFEDLSMGNASYPSAVRAVATRFGLYDFEAQSRLSQENPPKADPNFHEIERKLLGALGKDIGELLHFTNPLNFIREDFPPLLIQHGSEDKTVPVEHAYMLRDKVSSVCGDSRVETVIMEGYDHGGIDPRWNDQEHDEVLFKFFDRCLK